MNDYGLKWVGHNSEATTQAEGKAISKEIQHGNDLFKVNYATEVDVGLIGRRIEELNYIMGSYFPSWDFSLIIPL